MWAVLQRDFLTIARSRRYFAMRAAVVGFVAFYAFAGGLAADTADLGTAMFVWAAEVLLYVTLFVAPGVMATALAEDRKRGRLDILGSTPLSMGSLVAGLFVGRTLLQLSAVVAVLPLLAFALLYGGLSSGQFIKATLVIVGALLFHGSIGLCCGAYARTAAGALRGAYTLTFCAISFPSLISLGLMVRATWLGGATTTSTMEPLVNTIAMGLSPDIALFTIHTPVAPAIGANMPTLLDPWAVYVIGSLVASGLLVAMSIAILDRSRAPGFSNTQRTTKKTFASRVPRVLRPWIPESSWSWLALGTTAVLEIAWVLSRSSQGWAGMSAYWFRLIDAQLANVLLFLAMITVAAHAATSWHDDRERNTRDVLFAAPMTTRQMCFAKVASSFRGAAVILGIAVFHGFLACVGYLDQEITRWAFGIFVVGSLIAYAVGGAVGLTVGLLVRTSSLAMVWTVVGLIAITVFAPSVAHLLLQGGDLSDVVLTPQALATKVLFPDPMNPPSVSMGVPEVILLGYGCAAFVAICLVVPRLYGDWRDGLQNPGWARLSKLHRYFE